MRRAIYAILSAMVAISLLILIYWLYIGEIARFAITEENKKSNGNIIYSIYHFKPVFFTNDKGNCVELAFRHVSPGGHAIYCESKGRYTVYYDGE